MKMIDLSLLQNDVFYKIARLDNVGTLKQKQCLGYEKNRSIFH